jgi:hypothetical protein
MSPDEKVKGINVGWASRPEKNTAAQERQRSGILVRTCWSKLEPGRAWTTSFGERVAAHTPAILAVTAPKNYVCWHSTNQSLLAADLWKQTYCGAEVTDYENVPDTTVEPSCHFRLLHRTQGEYLSFRPKYGSHCFAEVTHSLMQTNSQLRRGFACQASKQRIEESKSEVQCVQTSHVEPSTPVLNTQIQAATACAEVVANPTVATVFHRPVSRRRGDADNSD